MHMGRRPLNTRVATAVNVLSAKMVKSVPRSFLSHFDPAGHLRGGMNTNPAFEPDVLTDASLVELSLHGDRDAFGQIVGRYFEVLGTPGRFLPLLAAFVVGMGVIYQLRRHRSTMKLNRAELA